MLTWTIVEAVGRIAVNPCDAADLHSYLSD